MKKFLSIVLCFVCILSFTFPVSAFSSDDNVLNGVELDAMRLSASILGKSEIEIANEILYEMGIDEGFIENIPDYKKSEIANASSILRETEYSKVDSTGTEIALNEEAFNNEISLINESLDNLNYEENLVSPMAEVPDNGLHLEGEDEYLIKNMYIYETKNAPTGTYGIFVTYEWINYMSRWHGEDVIGIAGEGLTFAESSFCFLGQYGYKQHIGSTVEYGTEGVYADYDSLEDENDLLGKDNGITYQFNLKNNIHSLISPLYYTEASFMMIVSSRINDWALPKTFNIFSSYFHQYVGLGSVGVSVNITGASISVSPTLCYTECQIATEQQIDYYPNL